jgi:hypothetical protein
MLHSRRPSGSHNQICLFTDPIFLFDCWLAWAMLPAAWAVAQPVARVGCTFHSRLSYLVRAVCVSHFRLQNDHRGLVQILIKLKADVNAQNGTGQVSILFNRTFPHACAWGCLRRLTRSDTCPWFCSLLPLRRGWGTAWHLPGVSAVSAICVASCSHFVTGLPCADSTAHVASVRLLLDR